MLSKILRGRTRKLVAENENQPAHGHSDDVVLVSDVRDLATGAALAAAVDASPAVLVNIYDHAHRTRGRGRRVA
jgi:hypothetical protein